MQCEFLADFCASEPALSKRSEQTKLNGGKQNLGVPKTESGLEDCVWCWRGRVQQARCSIGKIVLRMKPKNRRKHRTRLRQDYGVAGCHMPTSFTLTVPTRCSIPIIRRRNQWMGSRIRPSRLNKEKRGEGRKKEEGPLRFANGQRDHRGFQKTANAQHPTSEVRHVCSVIRGLTDALLIFEPVDDQLGAVLI